MTRFLKTFLTTLLGASALQGAHAVDKVWPVRPINFVVPFTPGGVTDNTARTLGKLLSARLGQAVVVDNRPGAGGSVGVEYGARQAPDGYTIILGTQGTQAANLALYKNVRYDPIKDFVPVHGLAEISLLLVVNPERPYKTASELIAYAKANPGKVNFASAGAGTGTHLTAELFQAAAGIKMTHIPYKGSVPALTDLLAGNVDVMFDYASVLLPHVQANKLRPLAYTGKSQLALIPSVPTVGELGYPNAQASGWSAVFLPARTPPAIAKRLADEVARTLEDPEMLQLSEKAGGVPMRGMREAKLGSFIKTEMVKWRDIVKRSGATLD